LIQTFKEDDSVFSVEEGELLEKLIKNNKSELQKNLDNYTEICFETGKLYWYYYDYADGSQIARAKSAIEWFQDVLDNAPEGYENLGMARVYANIGIFYRDITTNITEASDKGQYEPLFENLTELMNTVAVDESESEIVRLELIELTRSALQQYGTKFKTDGISKDQLLELYDLVESSANSINTTADKTQELKETIISNLADTKAAIELAYSTSEEGD
jgi:serine/threonine-protein kinase